MSTLATSSKVWEYKKKDICVVLCCLASSVIQQLDHHWATYQVNTILHLDIPASVWANCYASHGSGWDIFRYLLQK